MGAVLRTMLLPVALVGALAACGGGDDAAGEPVAAATTAAPSDTGSAAAPTEPADGGVIAAPEALQFSAPLVGGGDIEVASLAGRPVLLWFWAPW